MTQLAVDRDYILYYAYIHPDKVDGGERVVRTTGS
jgi:hypothetical protein